jgi:hypothetical protein
VCTLLLLPVLLIHDFDSVGMNIYPSGNKLLGGSAKKSEGVENKLSISDICKRRLVDQESEARALPLSAWDTQEPEIDCADWSCVGSPAKSEKVYTKRHKTTPLTPPLRPSCRRREPSPPPGFEPEMRITEVALPMAEQGADDDSLNMQPMSLSIIEDDR